MSESNKMTCILDIITGIDGSLLFWLTIGILLGIATYQLLRLMCE